MTEFQQKVYKGLLQIPEGKVSTYGLLADYVKCNSARAVGQALKKNPDSPRIPCHRIIRSDLTTGGFFGRTDGEELQRKLSLLRDEGVNFDDCGRLIDKEQLFYFS